MLFWGNKWNAWTEIAIYEIPHWNNILHNKTVVTKGLRLKAKTSHRHSPGIYLEGAHWGNALALSPPILFFTPGKRRDSSHWLFGGKNQGLWLSPFLFCLCLGSRSNCLKSMLSLPLCALSVRWPSLGLKMGRQGLAKKFVQVFP